VTVVIDDNKLQGRANRGCSKPLEAEIMVLNRGSSFKFDVASEGETAPETESANKSIRRMRHNRDMDWNCASILK
jgi:hypothetical protein